MTIPPGNGAIVWACDRDELRTTLVHPKDVRGITPVAGLSSVMRRDREAAAQSIAPDDAR